jgi:hypothetical protein
VKIESEIYQQNSVTPADDEEVWQEVMYFLKIIFYFQ